jgi:hypothetical protein
MAHWTASTALGNSAKTLSLGDQPVHHVAMSRQGAERLNLVVAHQARVSRHVSGEDRREPSLHPVLLPIHGTLGAISAGSVRRTR